MFRYLQSILLIIMCCIPIKVAAQDSIPSDSCTQLLQRLSLQRKYFPQEKFHVMTDAELYQPGDTIWMHVWVQDGLTLRESRLGSQFVYVELRDGAGTLVDRVKIRKSGGQFSGHFVLPANSKTGGYTLIAYTLYMSQVPDRFMFRKPIYILSRIDEQKGYTARPLIEKKCKANRLVPTQGQITSRGDTLTRITFKAPADTWLSISVTDDELSPIDTTLLISHCLPAIAPLFNEESISQSPKLYKAEIPIEKTGSFAGKILNSNPENIELSAVNLTTQAIYFTKPDEKGDFIFNDVDMPEDNRFFISAYRKGQRIEARINLFEVLLPQHLPALTTDPRNYFVNLRKEKDSIITKNSEYTILPGTEVVSNTSKTKNSDDFDFIKWTIKRKYVPDDEYTINATQSIINTKFPHSNSNCFVSHVITSIEGITIEDGVAYWQDNKDKGAKKVPVCFVLNNRQLKNQIDANGKLLPQIALRYPNNCLYAVDFLAPDVARRLNNDPAFKDSPIIRLDFLADNEMLYGELACYITSLFGYQRPLLFQNLRIRHELIHTRYWNPATNSGPKGEVSLDLPLPSNHHTSYSVRAEGVTSDGQPFSYVGRFKM